MWPFSRSVPPEAAACERCSGLRLAHEIRTPGELTQATRVARARLADGTLRDVTPRDLREVEFARLPDGGPWPDFVEYYFRCAACGSGFRLSADTYRDAVGDWQPFRARGHSRR